MSLRQDVTFAIRTLRRRRTFALIAILTIALGVGAATSIYSVVDGVLFRPLPFREAGRLVAVWQTYPQWRKQPVLAAMWDRIPLSLPEFGDWRSEQRSFSDVGIWSNRGNMLLGNTETPEMVPVLRTSASLLNVLQVTPVIGRNFTDEEDMVGGAPVVMLSHATWQHRYGGALTVVGSTIRLDGQPYTVVGVLPPNVTIDRGSTGVGEASYWAPAGQDATDAASRGSRNYRAIGRLRPGITLSAATTETDRILRGESTPDRRGVRLEQWQVDQTRTVRQPLLVLLAAVGVLLLISCVNVAVLLLGEAVGREPEMATRMALGAGRGRIIFQLLTESVVLAATGAVVGTGLAFAGTKALVALAPPRIPGLEGVALDVRVLLFTLTVTAATGILFGMAPALALGLSSPSRVVRGAGGQSASGRGRLQRIMVAIELGLSFVLLVGAGLLSRSLTRLTAVDPGFRTDHLLSVRVALPRTEYDDSSVVREFHRQAVERLSAIPGVVAVTASTTAPFTGGNSSSSIEIEGRPAGDQGTEAQQRVVLPNYFAVMGIPLLRGRFLSDEDRTGGARAMVISRAEAERDFPDTSPIGKRVRFQGVWWEVVGVVGDTKYATLATDDRPTIYTSSLQRPAGSMTLLIRTSVEPTGLTPAVRAALRVVAPAAPFVSAEPMTSLIRRSSAEERYRTTLISLFGILAATLAAVGMYGVTARAMSRRTREIGIRMALGATAGAVVRLVVRYTLTGLAAGVAFGLIGARVASRALEPFLFGIPATDVSSYTAAVVLLALVGLGASWLPARRASRVQPAVVLKSD